MAEEKVVLVSHNDEQIGLMEKMKAHENAILHRAFSVFVFNGKKELMLQQRALHKYHSPGLWTNTCCSHPRHLEEPELAGHRRMMEEMGFDCDLKKAFNFIYKADVGQGLTEYEFDHVFVGYSDKQARINPDEVADWKYMKLDDIAEDMILNPENYTVWFRIAFDKLIEYLVQK
jgi:isopentenyl-diphosphate Delta-isomerase